jgi:putative selenium metabolism protein SsnA
MLITNANLLTWGADTAYLTDYALYIDAGLIADMGPSAELAARYPQAERYDANGQIVMPGNTCAHTHFYGAYARGLATPGDPPADFPQILRRLWWSLDQALDAESVRASVLVALVDAIKHGTTTLIDHHASPNFIDGSLDVIANAVDQAGLRAVLCYEVSDRGGDDKAHEGIAENLRFMAQNAEHPRVRGTFGLHASFTLNDALLQACADAIPDDAGFHIHLAEHEADENDSLSRSGQRVVQRLDAYGIWRQNTLAAHGVHVDHSERDLLQQRGVWLTHQPRSNMNNGVGAADIDGMLAQGLPVCLGNDGMGNNMFAEWKTAYLLQKAVHRDPRRANGADIARMATQHNAALLAKFFPDAPLGELRIGACADLMLLDYKPYTPLSAGNAPWHILFGVEASMVTGTLVDGVWLMRERELLTLDEREVMAEALAIAPKVWERYRRYAEATWMR